jgi:predicted transcriptional regulator
MQASSSLLSPSEFRIYAVLARHGPLTIRDVGRLLAQRDPDFSLGYNSLGTLLQRMVRKGFVLQEDPQGTAAGKLYRPLASLDFAIEQQVEAFLDSLRLDSQEDLRIVIEIVSARLPSL